MGWAYLGAVHESLTSDSGGGSGSPGLALVPPWGTGLWEPVEKSWGWGGGLSFHLLSISGIGGADACERWREGTTPPKKRASGLAAAGQNRTECRVSTGRSGSAPLPSRPCCRRSSGRFLGEGSGSAGDSTAEELGRCKVGKKECCPHCSPVAP